MDLSSPEFWGFDPPLAPLVMADHLPDGWTATNAGTSFVVSHEDGRCFVVNTAEEVAPAIAALSQE